MCRHLIQRLFITTLSTIKSHTLKFSIVLNVPLCLPRKRCFWRWPHFHSDTNFPSVEGSWAQELSTHLPSICLPLCLLNVLTWKRNEMTKKYMHRKTHLVHRCDKGSWYFSSYLIFSRIPLVCPASRLIAAGIGPQWPCFEISVYGQWMD